MIELGGKTKAATRFIHSPGNENSQPEGDTPWPLDWNRNTRTYGQAGKLISPPSDAPTASRSQWGYLWDSIVGHKPHAAPQAAWCIDFKLRSAEGAAAMANGHFAQAEASYRQALHIATEVEPTHEALLCRSQATCSLASMLANLDRVEAAERLLVQTVNAIERHSPAASVIAPLYHHLGMIYRTSSRPADAIRMFDHALTILPANSASKLRAAAFMGKGLACADFNDHALAAHSFLMVNRELEVESIRPSKRKLEAKICAVGSLVKQGDFTSAEAVCREALELSEILGISGVQNAALWNMLGFTHARCNHLPEAIQAYRSSLAVLNDSSLHCPEELADAHFNLAVLYAASGRSDEADVHLRRAADVVDTEAREMQTREAHFRRVFMQHFLQPEPTVKTEDLPEMLLFSQPH